MKQLWEGGSAMSKSSPKFGLVSQANGLIEACRAAIGSARNSWPEAATVAIARAIVSEAKRQRPDDAVIQSISLANPPDWNDIISAMQVVVKTSVQIAATLGKVETLAAQGAVTQESIETLLDEIRSLPSEQRNAVVNFLTSLSAGALFQAILEGARCFGAR